MVTTRCEGEDLMDEAPKGYVTTRVAAEHLGLSQQAIRNGVRAGRIAGRVKETERGETRYYVAESALNREGPDARV